ncbi:STAS domain-containing protein [Streptomyces sp. NPDC127072]|uniref:STAS domain-containing protein n=1 Tax=Streptomyces sp. NPDC127072 TaxID=3347129 RepID=UPI003669C306
MPFPQFTVHRHDRRHRALITLAGEIDLESAPLVRTALERCLKDGIHTIDVDLTPVTFCDCSGLNTFLHAAQQATEAGATLRLHCPPPTLTLLLDLTGCEFLLLGSLFEPLPPALGDAPASTDPAPTHRQGMPVPVFFSGDVR